MARDCPEESECYRCNQPGHIARYCLEESRSNDHRSRRNGLKECYLCQSTDHIQANCPSALCYRYDQKWIEIVGLIKTFQLS